MMFGTLALSIAMVNGQTGADSEPLWHFRTGG
jgi:hypothetical protein